MIDVLRNQLIFEEGLRLHKYKCPAGHWTIGVGRNIDASPYFKGQLIKPSISKELALEILDFDIDNAERQLLNSWSKAYKLTQPRFDACVNMVFQMGIGDEKKGAGFMGFVKMRKALEDSYYDDAYYHVLDSDWHKQSPDRARRVAWQLRHGRYYAIPEH